MRNSASPDESVRRPPTTGFPTVALPEAIETIGNIAKYGTRHSRAAFAQYLGHESAYSGPFKTKLAAYRDWGLVTTGRDTVDLTELAVRLALPPDPSRIDEDVIAAFRSCAPFAEMYETCAKGQPLEAETIANMAVHRLGVTPQAKERFAFSFIRSVIAAGLADDAGADKVRLLAEARPSRASAAASPSSSPSPSVPPSRSGIDDERAPAAGAAVSLAWPIASGEISFVIRTNTPLPSTVFAHVGAVTDAIETLVPLLATVEAVDDESTSLEESHAH
jgi:hypothetical protein